MPAPSRRDALTTLAGLGAAATLGAGMTSAKFEAAPARPAYQPRGRIKHSAVWWCYHAQGDKWPAERFCTVAKELGLASIELVEPEHWPLLAKHGLTCAIAGNGYPKAGFVYGLNNPKHSAEVVAATSARMERCAEAKVPSVIAFTGMKHADPADPKSGDLDPVQAAKHTVDNLKTLAKVGERLGVTVCIEHLNSRDDSHPMKGHPGYQGDNVDELAAIVKAVGSPRVKLLFDLYHVQVMHGDLIRRIDQNFELIGHVHTAGCPGRGELDATQEVNYPAVMAKLAAKGYAGYVGHEFIPTRDAYAGLAEAVRVCDA